MEAQAVEGGVLASDVGDAIVVHDRYQLTCLRVDIVYVILALGGRPAPVTAASSIATGWPMP
jgi:hypothetical protein